MNTLWGNKLNTREERDQRRARRVEMEKLDLKKDGLEVLLHIPFPGSPSPQVLSTMTPPFSILGILFSKTSSNIRE